MAIVESEQRVEFRDDIRHAFEDLLQKHNVRGFAWRREVLDRYKNGNRERSAVQCWARGKSDFTNANGHVAHLRDVCCVPAPAIDVPHGKLPCDVVETGAKIGDQIPDYAREGRVWLGCDDTFDT